MKKLKLKTAEDARLINAFKENKDSLINDIYNLIENAALNDNTEIEYSFKKTEYSYYAQIRYLIQYFKNKGFYVIYNVYSNSYTIKISW